MLVLRLPVDLRLPTRRLSQFRYSYLGHSQQPRVNFSPPRKIPFDRCRGRIRAMSSSPLVVKERIELTEVEEKIFQRLLDVVRHYKLETQLRVAGGWVRDKLLGRECYDIDIALDGMLGREFCEKVQGYLGEGNGGGYCVIQSNPDQSKHLETARMRIFDMWIDFVNLRSEKYAENSRIPEMEFGSAQEDAYRRDLTINSLFYNINTNSVEDLTGRGIEDLKSGRVVTPLPPKATFLDDPLRVLRAIRFGARFDFVLDVKLKEAASDAEVNAALKEKISRERIGHEVDLMMGGNQPVKAITWIYELQLFWAVFTPPDNPEPPAVEESDKTCIACMDVAWNALQLIGYSTVSDEKRRLYLYGALFYPLREYLYIDKRSKKLPVSSHIIRNSLKLKTSDVDMVVNLHETSEKFTSFINSLDLKDSEVMHTDLDDELLDVPLLSRRRVLLGLILRRIKDYWRVALLISAALNQKPDHIKDIFQRVENFKRVENIIIELNLDKVWELKPLLDGNSIMTVLQIKGRQIGEWQQRILKWQLAHPDGTADDCRDWMKQSDAKRIKLQ